MLLRNLVLSVAATLTAGAATAGSLTPPPGTMLSTAYPVSIEQYTQAGFIVPGATVESMSAGQISYSHCYVGGPSCAYGESDVELGGDPSLNAFVSTTCNIAYPCTHTDDYSPVVSASDSHLDYYIELQDFGKTAPELVNFKAADFFNLTGGSSAGYAFSITGITNALQIQACTSATDCYEGIPQGSIASVTHIMLVPNAVYSVRMELYTRADGHTGDTAFAALDPEFFLPNGSTGTLAYSVGVASPAPEPASWALMLGGVGTTGGMMRRRRAAGSKSTGLGFRL